ncbi:MAG: hypothetical protein GX605_14380 [Chloroflexi bacterium]|nr:hypothetical protein [Chloroflexota bacterium]
MAASWLLMAVELPALSVVVARLPNPEANLAAYGGVIWPLAMIIEAPIVMLLSASTALSRNWATYRKIYRFMMVSGACLTLLHLVVAFTPLYYWVAESLLGVPPEVVEPGRLGLRIMTPWAWAIGYRRFQQGVLIRFGHSRAVGVGTAVRLVTDCLVLALGYSIGSLPGAMVGSGAVALGVVAEAAYAGWRVQPVLRSQVRPAPAGQPLTWRAFADFYVPLMLTSMMTLALQPIGSAALSRMPHALDSLATWPVLTGLVFMLRSAGMAYNEVVVALLDEPGSSGTLRRFTTVLGAAVTALMLVLAATPLARLWFSDVSALPPRLAEMARVGLWLALPLPLLNVLQSWYQGAILHGRRTRGIPEAVVLATGIMIAVLVAGIVWGRAVGLYVGVVGLTAASASQTLWLWVRSRPVMAVVRRRDEAASAACPGGAPTP